ncbi:hypothetical protein TraAM80_06164 [Trypanosoma rangeli]|uniref:Uncharacterized protein n=1 Tax=Trypanosoma rangeli TaxID=5698 RepID=A0A3R7MBF3_TRYRA|nr:uncharacterized protein TraAM80_06164 [Trypanosoma rangeli]RNF02812.1 hypothetical protein TraAM80_06164 [Trypanosoma rangeli]|eukprot:RNF02812.1 hypothetical protein TraAM80_06164 [Trypanosoma rangeli]
MFASFPMPQPQVLAASAAMGGERVLARRPRGGHGEGAGGEVEARLQRRRFAEALGGTGFLLERFAIGRSRCGECAGRAATGGRAPRCLRLLGWARWGARPGVFFFAQRCRWADGPQSWWRERCGRSPSPRPRA